MSLPSTTPPISFKFISLNIAMTEEQLEALIFSEFKILLSSSRFNEGSLVSRRKILISAFESHANDCNVDSFCSQHSITRDIVSSGLVRLATKMVFNGITKPNRPVISMRFPNSLALVTDEQSQYDRTLEEKTDSNEEVPSVPLAENAPAPAPAPTNPNKYQNAFQYSNQRVALGIPVRRTEAPFVEPTVPVMVHPFFTSLTVVQNGVGGAPKQPEPVSQGVGEEGYSQVPIYNPLPVLIGGTAIEVNSGRPLNSKPSARKKSMKIIPREIQGDMATDAIVIHPLTNKSPKKKTKRGRRRSRKGNVATPHDSTEEPPKKQKKKQKSPTNNNTEVPSSSLPPRPSFLPAISPPAVPPSPTTNRSKSLARLLKKHKQNPIPLISVPTAVASPFPPIPVSSADETAFYVVNNIIQQNFPSPDKIFLPYPIQFAILTETQYVLECVCHSFAKKWLPHLTSTTQFLYPESAELSLWIRTIAHPANIAAIPSNAVDIAFMLNVIKAPNIGRFLDDSSKSLVRLRNQTVHRHKLDCNDLHQELQTAVDMAMFLKRPNEAGYLRKILDKQNELGAELGNQINQIRADIKKALETLYYHRRNTENWSASVVKIGVERTEKALEGVKLTLDDLRALKLGKRPDNR
ncbi:hypothetical protein AOL_s00076g66 [Orbilia oligospora ATCC 24927]|uniref:Uncharacterized protein n=2 Tax=Orbilia oligospora TaxID=2813651 RepID=G1X8V9_ARTOA|nr:hypothetical protein AOL_s00076g66 [Orbilia oligospora ATCC 24927]EGX50302.1 hypothetical protein AOL_s00076g66 [Orbilia oligospora ATCC 24927]KAF3278531.1 hypothetical protein TWF970_004538 [Orbilia oligospora]